MIVLIRLLIMLLNIIYLPFKLLTVVQNKVTLISRQSNSIPLDFELLNKEFDKELPNIKIVILSKSLNNNFVSISKYAIHMLVQMYHISTSKVVVLDSYCIVASVLKHKKSLMIIQMWHSMGSMKKFGYTALNTNEGSKDKIAKTMKMHNNYSYFFASSEAYAEDLAAGFNCSLDKLEIKPLPRLDLLMDEKYKYITKSKVINRYPILKEKKNILYCPTFRKDEKTFQKAADELIKIIDLSKYNLIISLHPLSNIQITDSRVIVPNDLATFDMMFISDYIISDYSCVVFEAAVLNIPIHFYCFDIDEYTENRGLAIDYYKECPGVVSNLPENIMKAINDNNYDYKKLNIFLNKYIKMTNSATKDIVKFIETLLKRS